MNCTLKPIPSMKIQILKYQNTFKIISTHKMIRSEYFSLSLIIYQELHTHTSNQTSNIILLF